MPESSVAYPPLDSLRESMWTPYMLAKTVLDHQHDAPLNIYLARDLARAALQLRVALEHAMAFVDPDSAADFPIWKELVRRA